MRELILILSLVITAAAGAESEKFALVGGTVITATGERPITNSVVLIEDGHINQLGTRDVVTVTEEYRTIDVTGKWITPGLIDSNIHLILMTVPEFFH